MGICFEDIFLRKPTTVDPPSSLVQKLNKIIGRVSNCNSIWDVF